MRRILALGAALIAGTLTNGAPAQAEILKLGAAAPASQGVEFDVYLPLRNKAGLEALLKAQQDPNSHLYHQWLSPAQFAERFGPSAASLQKAARGFAERGLAVDIQSRSLHITGTADVVSRALGASLVDGVTVKGEHHLVAAHGLSLPQEARDVGAFMFDFQRTTNTLHTDSRRVPGVKFAAGAPLNRESSTGGYYFDDLKQAYSYPSYQTMVTVNSVSTRLDGTGTTIGILMSSAIYGSDITAMFNQDRFAKVAGLSTNPALYKSVKIRGGSTTSSDALDEASLDTQQAIGGAPGAHVILYEIPSLSDSNILAGYTAIVNANAADVVSSSFGGCELFYTAAYGGSETSLTTEHEEFMQGNALGMTFLASSGDSSGLGCVSVAYADGGPGTFIAGVETPASDPNVTGVGGTNLVTSYTANHIASTYHNENAYSDPEVPYDPYGTGQNATGGIWGAGGGDSVIWTEPSFQTVLKVGTTTARAVPDIGMQVGGCPGSISVLPCNGGDTAINGNGNTNRSYVFTVIDGTWYGLIGTSVASPELSGAVALMIEAQGRQGNLNPYIYSSAAAEKAAGGVGSAATTLFHAGIPGYNGVVANGSINKWYNNTTGVGTPYVYRLIGESGAAVAGNPQTSTNP